MLARTLGDALRIEYETDPDLPPCVLDPVHAEMALLNVLANARDAMPGGGTATVRTGTVWLDEASIAGFGGGMRPGRYVALTVEDGGGGGPRRGRPGGWGTARRRCGGSGARGARGRWRRAAGGAGGAALPPAAGGRRRRAVLHHEGGQRHGARARDGARLRPPVG